MRITFQFAMILVLISAVGSACQGLRAQYSTCQFLCNIDFEQDILVSPGRFSFFDQSKVACWNTTASDHQIEIWGSGFGGVPAYSGSQFAELNANMVSTLFQRFKAGLGGSVQVSFAHRGRAGIDVMSVEVGPEGGPYQNLGSFSAGNTKWEFHEVNFNFPTTGRTDYVIRFNSVSAAGGATVGNFLDAISIKLIPPVAFYSLHNPDCEGSLNGSIVLDSIKGSSPYIFKWSNQSILDSSSKFNLSAGSYQLEIIDLYGCSDTLIFNLKPKYKTDTVAVSQFSCDKYYWKANNTEYTTSGVFVSIDKNRFGCDSLNVLNLSIGRTHIDTKFQKACGSYYWKLSDKSYFKSGTYSMLYQSQTGCDSMVSLKLQLFDSDITKLDTIVCQQFYWPSTQLIYKTSGRYIDSLTNSNGCDSFIFLDLKIDSLTSTISKVESCKDYYWDASDNWISNSGFYTKNLANVHGCDSIVQLNLTIHPSYAIKDSISNCGTFFWELENLFIDSSGIYSHTFKTIHGCDSIYQLNLNIHANSTTNIHLEGCDSVMLKGETYYADTMKELKFSSIFGCDSILSHSISIYPSSFSKIHKRACDEFYWDASQSFLSESGIYSWRGANKYGCDSTIKLDLIIDKSFHFYDTVVSYKPYQWKQDLHTYTADSFVMKSYSSVEGCDSIFYLNLKIEKVGDVWEPNVFSPNGDAVNDRFIVYSTPSITQIDLLQIFDRWGNLVFERADFPPNDEKFGWDGTFKNDILFNGVFSYVVLWKDLSNRPRIHKGDVTLLR